MEYKMKESTNEPSSTNTAQPTKKRGRKRAFNLKIRHKIEDVLEYCIFWENNKDKLPYDIDGIVLKINSLKQQKQLGFTSKNPRWATSFKFSAEQANSILRDIEIGVGRTGILTPVAILDPVELNNTTVSRASLHNYDQIERLNLHFGDHVILEKGGEIIPKIVGVDSKLRLKNRRFN